LSSIIINGLGIRSNGAESQKRSLVTIEPIATATTLAEQMSGTTYQDLAEKVATSC